MRNISRWVLMALGLIALYLVLEHYAGASSVLGTIAAGTMALFGTLQGRNVAAYGNQITTPAA